MVVVEVVAVVEVEVVEDVVSYQPVRSPHSKMSADCFN